VILAPRERSGPNDSVDVEKFPLKKQAMLLSMLGFYSPQENIPFLYEHCLAPKKEKFATLAFWYWDNFLITTVEMNQDDENLLSFRTSHPKHNRSKREEALDLLTHLPSSDIFGLLTTAFPFSTEEKLQFLKEAPKMSPPI